MKQMILTGIRQMTMTDCPEPVIEKPTDILLRIDTVGVCGSDIHYYTTGRIGSQVVEYPFAVGHECSAVVVEVGEAVEAFAPGDRVAVDPAVSCGECDQCRGGRRHTCRELKFMGCPGQMEGCLGEYFVMPAESCYRIPDDMTMDQAAIVEPLSIGVYAVEQSIPMAGARVGILGAGPIGLSILGVAKAEGAARIYVSEPLGYRRDKALEMGGDWAGTPDGQLVQAVTDQEPLLLDVVFECCGEQSAMDQGVELLRPGGKLMLVGIPEVDRVSFVPDQMRRKELCLQNVRRQNECVEKAIAMIADGRFPADAMVTHHLGLAETAKAFELVDDYADGVVKAMVHIE